MLGSEALDQSRYSECLQSYSYPAYLRAYSTGKGNEKPKLEMPNDLNYVNPKARTQTFQNPLIKEDTLNYNRIPNMIYGIYSLIKGFWKVWEPSTPISRRCKGPSVTRFWPLPRQPTPDPLKPFTGRSNSDSGDGKRRCKRPRLDAGLVAEERPEHTNVRGSQRSTRSLGWRSTCSSITGISYGLTASARASGSDSLCLQLSSQEPYSRKCPTSQITVGGAELKSNPYLTIAEHDPKTACQISGCRV